MISNRENRETRPNQSAIMERRDTRGAAKSSGVSGACSGDRRSRQDSRCGLFALRSVDGEEVSARCCNQPPARKKIWNQSAHRDQLAKKGMSICERPMAGARLDVYAALLTARSEREILLPIPAPIPSRVRGFASHLRFARAADTGPPARNLAGNTTQVLVFTLQPKLINGLAKRLFS
jgi:hypothetical protein